MTAPDAAAQSAEPVAVFAPFARDAAVLTRILQARGVATVEGQVVPEYPHGAINSGAGVFLLTAEAAKPQFLSALCAHLRDEPAWSMPPVVLLVEDAVSGRAIITLLEKARSRLPVTVLVRPCLEVEIASAVARALETRRAQRGYAEQLERRRAAEERALLLFQELSHRVKNMFQIVSMIGVRAESVSENSQDFRRAFESRMQALAATYDALRGADWRTAPLSSIVVQAVEPLLDPKSGQRLLLNGPALDIDAKHVVPLGLVLHELATNAHKYGALLRPDGVVQVDWRYENGLLDLVWREEGGPRVAPPTAEGFGSSLIRRSLGAGAVDLDYAPEGLRCRVRLPVED